jgi:hypothetical protein
MHILRIEHRVPDFGAWKKAFDSDPFGRKLAGVRRYRVLRLVDDARLVMIDLEFDSLARPRPWLARYARCGLGWKAQSSRSQLPESSRSRRIVELSDR